MILTTIATGVAVLAACGSGGGSDSTAATATSVSGVVAKGPVKNATVMVCRVVNGTPQADASCASGSTASDGSYRVMLADGYTGPAMVKVTAATSGSTMMDESTGADVPYRMTMRALVPSVSGNTTTYVTPFSEMAAGAMGAGTIDAARMTQAMAAVQAAMSSLGIDLGVMPMIDLRDNGSDAAALGMQANMVKQLARLATAAQTSGAITDASGTACSAAADASARIACVVAAMGRLMTSTTTVDTTRLAAMMQAMTAQDVTHVSMPVMRADGTLGTQTANMADAASMQSAMQSAGMTSSSAAGSAGTMMGRMH